jgi:hypothetical protein
MNCAARIYVVAFDRYAPRGQCSREADSTVCGVPVCWQHRNSVTEWYGGVEHLSARATREFEAWGVKPSGAFVPEP